jgi:hypothetical protein
MHPTGKAVVPSDTSTKLLGKAIRHQDNLTLSQSLDVSCHFVVASFIRLDDLLNGVLAVTKS